MDLLLVGIGGAAGSLLRYQLGKYIAEKARTTFPLGTFLINITGAIALGMIMTISMERNLFSMWPGLYFWGSSVI